MQHLKILLAMATVAVLSACSLVPDMPGPIGIPGV